MAGNCFNQYFQLFVVIASFHIHSERTPSKEEMQRLQSETSKPHKGDIPKGSECAKVQSQFDQTHQTAQQGLETARDRDPLPEKDKDDQASLPFRGGAPVSGIDADRPPQAETNQKLL
jgi:hypothetical protein